MNPAETGNRRGTGFAGPLAVPPWGGGAEGASGGSHYPARFTRSNSSRIRQMAPSVMAASATLKAGK